MSGYNVTKIFKDSQAYTPWAVHQNSPSRDFSP